MKKWQTPATQCRVVWQGKLGSYLEKVQRIQALACIVGEAALGTELHPVLRRVYAARGLRAREDLDLSLERLAALGVPRERSVPAVSLVVTQRLLPALCEACKRRDDLECAIDRYYPLVLEIIETVRAKAA